MNAFNDIFGQFSVLFLNKSSLSYLFIYLFIFNLTDPKLLSVTNGSVNSFT